MLFSSRYTEVAGSARNIILPLISSVCWHLPPLLRFGVIWLIRVSFLSIVGITAWFNPFKSIHSVILLSSVFIIISGMYFANLWFRSKKDRLQKAEVDKWEKLLATTNGLRGKIQEMWNVIEEMKVADNTRRDASKRSLQERQMAHVLEENVLRLTEDIQNMKKLKMELAEEQKRSASTLQKLLQENQKLKMKIMDLTKNDYLGGMHQVAQHLQTSLSAVKVKLGKVGDFLKDKHDYFETHHVH